MVETMKRTHSLPLQITKVVVQTLCFRFLLAVSEGPRPVGRFLRQSPAVYLALACACRFGRAGRSQRSIGRLVETSPAETREMNQASTGGSHPLVARLTTVSNFT